MQIVWTRRYLREFALVNDYIGERNPRAANRIVNEIHSRTALMLSKNALIGRVGEIEGTRELVLAGISCIVACRVHRERIEVLFVQHAAREWPPEAYLSRCCVSVLTPLPPMPAIAAQHSRL
ncbi:type II toxin-antitoxin system RelE/ParE family toxin [Rhizobium sp. SL42]|uniref:type II toxin-antitoxin system RelE/ParE family toxin n=1 Tax=Rhizobium sp. SL42 TaxID=2806346 RepID=UPI00301A39F7|nr:type II toxin-antitoxin system RelE/ParE family toxin [Rhizobium sp. SL42]